MTEFRALNNFARATGQRLQEKIDLAMPDNILDMRFNQNPDNPVDDEQFLQAAYRAGIQVQKKKALKGARDALRTALPPKDDQRKDRQNKCSSDNARKGKEAIQEQGKEKTREPKRKSQYGHPRRWASRESALTGVPTKEQEEYGRNMEDCWRCG